MYELQVEGWFSAAHRLRGYEGKCERLHGHNYKVQLTLGCDKLNSLGMVMDFEELKRIVHEVLNRIDHSYLNELEPFDTLNPTAEQLARHIAEEVSKKLPDGMSVRKLTCWESGACAASYIPGEAAAG